ncbi:MAG: hypothetical protein K6B46_01805 [Opitutales bacterium]|nr:hypothetical protein [Opitutales bacterium]
MSFKSCALPLLIAFGICTACVQAPQEKISNDSVLTASLPENLYVGKLIFISPDKKSAVLKLAPGLSSIFFDNDRLVARDKDLEAVALFKLVVLNKETATLKVLAGAPVRGLKVVKPSAPFLEAVEQKFLNSESQ